MTAPKSTEDSPTSQAASPPPSTESLGPDLNLETLADEPEPDRWEAIEDLTGNDLPLEEQDSAAEEPVDPWAPVKDLVEGDLGLPKAKRVERPDPWGDPAKAPDPDHGAVRAQTVALPAPPILRRLPRKSRPPKALAPPATLLPWRGTARVQSDCISEALYLTDPTTERSRWLVASCSPSWEEGDDARIAVRLVDDGPELTIAAACPYEPEVEWQIELAGVSVRCRLRVEVGRQERGLILGRDVLAGRFSIDPSQPQGDELDSY